MKNNISEKKFTVERDIIMYALRYSLGRRTFAPTVVIENIKENINLFSLSDLKLIHNEIKEHKNFGSETDAKDWINFKIYLKEMIEEKITLFETENYTLTTKKNIIDFAEGNLGEIEEKDFDEKKFRRMALEYALPISFFKKDGKIEVDINSLMKGTKNEKFEIKVFRITKKEVEYLYVEEYLDKLRTKVSLIRMTYYEKDHIGITSDIDKKNVSSHKKRQIRKQIKK